MAAGYTASTIGALVISLTVGLFGFHESIHASFVVESLVIEGITVLALTGWTVLVARRILSPAHRPRPAAQPGHDSRHARATRTHR